MNAVEIETAVSELALQPFDREEFPFSFLQAFGNKETTIKRLRSGASNKSDLGGILQTNNIHIAIAQTGEVSRTLAALKASPSTTRAKARFILSTDGVDFEAEDLDCGETVACAYQGFPDHFGFFLPLAGITTVKQLRDDLFSTPLDQAEIDFENEGGETFICGNPPYAGKGKKTPQQLDDMELVFGSRGVKHGYIDYVGCWFIKATDYGMHTKSAFAFVTTNSLCQGHQLPLLWPLLWETEHQLFFAHTSFKWANLASHNAGVTVAIIGMTRESRNTCKLFFTSDDGNVLVKEVSNISCYLVEGANFIIEKRSSPLAGLSQMDLGNMPYDGGNLLLSRQDVDDLRLTKSQHLRFIRRIYGSKEFISNLERYCLWVENEDLAETSQLSAINNRINAVKAMRLKSTDSGGRAMASRPHQMREMRVANNQTIVMPRTSSESCPYLPAGLLDSKSIVSSEAFAIFDAPLWQLALVVSRAHLVWIATICDQLETRYRYSNVLGWNTFPVPTLTEKNKADLTRCAEDILLAREAHFPATIADLYEPDAMPADLRQAHERNDEVLERIYIGRRFRNDTERLEKLFELYTKMTANAAKTRPASKAAWGKKS